MTDQRRTELENILYPNKIFHDDRGTELGKILQWADRWAGRPSREQIEKAVQSETEYLRPPKPFPKTLAGIILALYPSPAPERPKVTREQIEKVIRKREVFNWHPIVDDLCKLIKVEEDKRWCECWDKKGSAWLHKGCTEQQLSSWACSDWKLCPYCGASKPED